MTFNTPVLSSIIKYRSGSGNKFFWLLISLCLLIFLPSFATNELVKDTMIYLSLMLVIISGVFVLSRTKQLLHRATFLAAVTLLSNTVSFSIDTKLLFLFRMASLIFFFAWLLYFVFASLARTRRISKDIIYGAVDGYLILGVLGGLVFRIIHFLYPNSFIVPEMLESKLDVFTYFSFVTLTNLGYGDISPISSASQSMALFLAISGQMYLAVVMAILVGKFILFRSKWFWFPTRASGLLRWSFL